MPHKFNMFLNGMMRVDYRATPLNGDVLFFYEDYRATPFSSLPHCNIR
ncbi:MAG: hypothetical protein IT269_10745 [Saprospiraceae bacterium]|nr:hypothetical protein [Saprospiraceae bacterium]